MNASIYIHCTLAVSGMLQTALVTEKVEHIWLLSSDNVVVTRWDRDRLLQQILTLYLSAENILRQSAKQGIQSAMMAIAPPPGISGACGICQHCPRFTKHITLYLLGVPIYTAYLKYFLEHFPCLFRARWYKGHYRQFLLFRIASNVQIKDRLRDSFFKVF